MGKLPTLSGKELIKILQKAGFVIVRQKSSHVSLSKDKYRTVVPLQPELAKGTLLAILRQTGLTREDI